MGNSPSSHEDAVSSSGGADEMISDTSATTTGEKNVVSSSSGGAKSTSILSPTKSNFRGTFNPNISIQTLGSGGPGDDAGVYYNLENPTSTVGQSLGAALVGVGANNNNNQNNISGSGDVILSSLPKDLNSSNLGGRIVAIQRLLPGSGRMMRSYRMRVSVAKIDNYGSASKPTTANNNDTVATPVSSSSDNNNRSNGVSTMELACKSFIVRSEKGESPLRLALTEGDAELKRLRTILSDPSVHPHILSYSRWLIGPSSSSNSQPTNNFPVARPIYLIRQHAHASLCDRLFSRPFLTLIEKNWITYQSLRALQSLHDAGVCHGHLTTENILLTSWNWVLISDVGCQHFKPVALPDDDPGLWIHWFEGRGDEQVKRESWVGHHHRGGDKKCCLAPERFYTPGCNETEIQTELTPANDIFSLGCVLIELFLGGERALDLGDLMEYRRQGIDSTALPQTLKQKLDKIESSKMRAACKNMMSLDPSARLTPIEYLERLSSSSKRKDSDEPKAEKSKSGQHSSTVAPISTCFQSALYPFMLRLRTEILSPDARIALVACNYGSILKATVGVDDDWGDKYFSRVLGPTLRRIEGTCPAKDSVNPAVPTSKGPSTTSAEIDIGTFSLDKLLMETEMLLRQLDSGVDTVKTNSKDRQTSSVAKVLKLADNFTQCTRQPSAPHSSIIVLLQVVFSTVRHVQRASSKFVALQLMHRIALFSSDEIRLQRIVPLVTSLLQDSEPIVRSSSISVVASVLATVTSFPPSDAQIFPKYVFKKVAHLITDVSLIVRVAFAKNIAILAETALRFLDVGHSVSLYEAVAARQSLESSGRGESNEGKTRTASAIFPEEAASLLGKQKGTSDTNTASTKNTSVGQRDSASTSTTTIKNTYDSDLAVLQEVVFRWFIHITTDTSDHSSQSKQALLSDLPRLCTFFRAEYSFQLLPIVLAFLNDRKDWQLRAALCRHLPSVCVSVGRAATEQFVIPCIETALNDEVEKVIIEALNCLSTLISLSLLTRVTLLGNELAGNSSPRRNESPRRSHRKKQGVVKKCAALLMNPSPIVRQYAGSFIISCWTILDETDSEVFLNMLLRPYLRFKPTTFESMSHLFACVKPPQPKKNMTTDALAAKCNVDTEIEISAKLASILSVPNIQSVELVSSCIPMWYESMMRSSLENQALIPSFLSLGFVSLRQVYALNIEEPVCTSNRILCCNANNKKASEIIKNNAEMNERGITNIMTSPDVKAVDAVVNGEWGSAAVIDQTIPENGHVHNKIQPLNVPPLPPRLGVANTYNADTNVVKNWSPKEDNMIVTTSAREHSGPVNRLSVSADQSFFASACFDGTSKVFELRQVQDSGGEIHSCITYDGHKKDCGNVRINDVTILKNSHTVATAASDGSLHVWRVDMVTSKQQSQLNNQSPVRISRPRVSGHCAVRTIDTEEGELLSVKHFNTPSASILTYATQRGNLHSLDLRCGRQPFSLHMRPELGYLTDMEVGNDKNWIVAGTSRGFIGLWDIRFQTMVKLWRHSRDSSIRRLTNAFGHETNENFTRPLVFMGCDNNEASLFDVSTGDCRQCYRVLDSSFSYVDQSALPLEYLSKPYLESVNIRSRRIVSLDKAIQMSTRGASLGVNVNALVPSINRRGKAFLVTGGSDHMIRYWDLHTSSKSYVVSGLARHQPPAEFESVKMGGESRLILCRQPSTPPANLVESAYVPSRNRQGMAKGDGGNHRDAILDLKLVKYPQMGLLSSSRDGTIKLFC